MFNFILVVICVLLIIRIAKLERKLEKYQSKLSAIRARSAEVKTWLTNYVDICKVVDWLEGDSGKSISKLKYELENTGCNKCGDTGYICLSFNNSKKGSARKNIEKCECCEAGQNGW